MLLVVDAFWAFLRSSLQRYAFAFYDNSCISNKLRFMFDSICSS